MTTQTKALQTLDPLAYRRFGGAIADLWKVRGAAGGGGFYIAPDPRLVVFLDDDVPPFLMRTSPAMPCRSQLRAFFIPANTPLWSHLDVACDFRHLDIHLQSANLAARIRHGGLRADTCTPRFFEDNQNLLTLARLAAREISQGKQNDMMLDGLLTAILADVFEPDRRNDTSSDDRHDFPPKGLNARQVATLEDLVLSDLSNPPGVRAMASRLGLSEGRFAHAFREALSMSPSKWVTLKRLRMAEQMMLESRLSLADIAYATGFADQAHMSRVFSSQNGMPPSRWRKLHAARESTSCSRFLQDLHERPS